MPLLFLIIIRVLLLSSHLYYRRLFMRFIESFILSYKNSES